LSIIAEATNVSLEKIRLLIPQELSEFVSNPEYYEERFQEREKMFLCLHTDFPLVDEMIDPIDSTDSEAILKWKIHPMSDPFIAEGDVAVKVLNQLNYRLNLYIDTDTGSDDLIGEVAFSDPDVQIVEGVVRIVKDPKNSAIKPGEILVAPSTTPDFLDALHKCSAIIVDWGGQSTHAAIVSRELKKPCIIGTRFASQILKTGQRVQMNLSTGNIKVLD
jgi:phosphohistidine swiveling domain-containing protein